MKKKYIISLVTCSFTVILVSILGGAGYLGYTLYMKKVQPVNAFKKATETISDYETAKFDIEIEAKYIMDSNESVYNQSIQADFKGFGELDIKKQEMKLDVDMIYAGEKINMKEILVDEVLYVKMGDEDWNEVALDDLEGEDMAYDIEDVKSDQIWARLSSDYDFDYKGMETINGKEAYNYSIELDRKETYDFAERMAESMGLGFSTAGGEESSFNEDDIDVSGIEYEVWVEKSTNMPIKEEIRIDEIKIEIFGWGYMKIKDVKMDYLYTSFNEEVDIEKP